MAADELVLYLRLAPEFGGTVFGPFEKAEVRLGSDPANNDITLPEALGVAAAHVRIYRNPDMGIIVSPVERTAAVFVWQGRAAKPKQITTNVAVRSGDAFALVTAQGPRFFLEMAELPPEVREQREAARQGRLGRFGPLSRMRGGRYLTKDALKGEARRQLFMRILVTAPGQFIQRAYTFIVSGAIFMPRNLFMIAGVAGGYVMGGVSMCNTARIKEKFNKQDKELTQVRAENEMLKELDKGPDQISYAKLLADITGSIHLSTDLDSDQDLADLVWSEARTMFGNPQPFSWLTDATTPTRQGRDFASFREALLKRDDMLDDVARVLAFVGAVPDMTKEGWSVVADSRGGKSCGRGLAGLTFRQSRNFGITAPLDHYIVGSAEDYEGEGSSAAREQALRTTAQDAGVPREVAGELLRAGETGLDFLGNKQFCLYVQSTDDRLDTGAVVRGLARHLSDKAKLVPEADEKFGVTSRIAKFHAADLPTVDFESAARDSAFKLNDATPPGSTVEDWVAQRTAETIARSVVLPCVAVLKSKQDAALETTFGTRPPALSCLILQWKLTNKD